MFKWLSSFGKNELTTEEAIHYIEDFLAGKGGAYDWDYFTSVRIKDPELDRIRVICGKLPDTHPPTAKRQYCSEEGRQVLREIVNQLRGRAEKRSLEAGR